MTSPFELNQISRREQYMAELQSESFTELPLQLQQILDLLLSAGYVDAGKSDISVSSKLFCGISCLLSTLNAPVGTSDVLSCDTRHLDNKIEIEKGMEEYLKLTGCPYRLSASKIDNLDCEKILPVVEWLVQHVEAMQEDRRGKYSCMEQTIKDEENTLLHLEFELKNRENSVKMLNANMDEENQKKANLISELQYLRERISKEGAYEEVRRLVSHMEILKDMENKVLNFQANNNARHCELQTEIVELEEKIASMNDGKSLVDDLDNSLKKSLEKLNLAKKNRAARLREIVSVKRKLDDFPSQSELIQYERRFSELYVHIQGKLRQTRNYYGTYNALLEIKELMLKETSLLNSISSQFQDAISSAAGRLKLTDSMEEIVKGSQQKLEKVQLALQEEQKVCDTLKERYIVAVAEQRRSNSLLLAFKEECPKNERLRGP